MRHKAKRMLENTKGTSRWTEPFGNVITIITHIFLYCTFHLMIPECIRSSRGTNQHGFTEFILAQLRDLTHVIFLFSTSPWFWLCPTSKDRSIRDCHHSWKHFSSWISTQSPGMAMPITTAEGSCDSPPESLPAAMSAPTSGPEQAPVTASPAWPAKWLQLRLRKSRSRQRQVLFRYSQTSPGYPWLAGIFSGSKAWVRASQEARCEGRQYLSHRLGRASSAWWAWSIIPGVLQKTVNSPA